MPDPATPTPSASVTSSPTPTLSPTPTPSPTPSPTPTTTPTPTPSPTEDFMISVAQNFCDPTLPPCKSFVAPIEGALTCTEIGDIRRGGFPRAGGTIQFKFFGEPCGADPTPSEVPFFAGNYNFVTLCAQTPPQDGLYSTTSWVSQIGYFYSRESIDGTKLTYRIRGRLVAPTKQKAYINLVCEVLQNNPQTGNYWATYFSKIADLDIVNDYSLIGSLYYSHAPGTYLPLTTNYAGGRSEITKIQIICIIEPLIWRCGDIEQKDRCGMWNGTNFYSCFRGLITSKTNAIFPKPFQMGWNSSNCGSSAICGCDECEATNYGASICDLNRGTFVQETVSTNLNEPKGVKQQIQVAFSSVPLTIVVKSILGKLYFMWKNTPGNVWEYSTGTVVRDEGSLTIYYASTPTSDFGIYFYVMKYPNLSIVPPCESVPKTSNLAFKASVNTDAFFPSQSSEVTTVFATISENTYQSSQFGVEYLNTTDGKIGFLAAAAWKKGINGVVTILESPVSSPQVYTFDYDNPLSLSDIPIKELGTIYVNFYGNIQERRNQATMYCLVATNSEGGSPFAMTSKQKLIAETIPPEPPKQVFVDETAFKSENRKEYLKQIQMRYSLPCIYLGEQLEDKSTCGCNGSPKYRCGLHGECRRLGIMKDVPNCSICKDYLAKS